MKDRDFNVYLGVGSLAAAAVVITFVTALMGSKAGEVSTALATVVSGSFVLGAAIIAWRSVQQQIASQERIEQARRESDIDGVESGFTSELYVYSSGVIQAASVWNDRATKEPQGRRLTNWPVYIDPLYYRTNVAKIGLRGCLETATV